MTWTRPQDLSAQLQKLWDRGQLLAPLADGDSPFPLRLTLKGPDSRELSERFTEVRDWIAELSANDAHYRIEWRHIKHRVLGDNAVPSAVWIDTLNDALVQIGQRRAAERFQVLVEQTRQQQPELITWLAKRPLRALELGKNWARLLDIVAWLLAHPRPSIYLRQIDLPGVHSKLIERHRGVLAELLDRVLPAESIDRKYSGVSGFCRRYGFLDKPSRVRLRILDPSIRLLAVHTEQDITLTQTAFAALYPAVSRVFITENEINFLAFPEVPDAMLLFGAGYGFDNLAEAAWLHDKKIHYWGDIDTHGFAILNQLRGNFAHAQSLLMDERTLLDHKTLWGVEPQPETGALDRLSPAENALYDQLRHNHWGERVRLEQERIGFDCLRQALQQLD